MSAWFPAPASPNSASTSSASTRTQARSRACKHGEMPIYEPGLDELVAANVAAGRLSFTTDLADGGQGRRGGVHRRRHAHRAAATAMPICPMSSPPPRRSPRALTGYTVVVTKSTVPVGTGRKVAEIIRKTRPDARIRRRLQSGIPARGLGDRGFHAARPRGDRRRERARPRGDARALPAALSERDADPVHRAARPPS